MDQKTTSKKRALNIVLWILAGLFTLGIFAARIFRPEDTWILIADCVALLACLVWLASEHRKALMSRTAAQGFNSVVTSVLVIGIVGVVNFLASKHEWKRDVTRTQINTLSDQTVKTVKGLNKEIKASLFSQPSQREQFRALLDNYKSLSPKLIIEYVDPLKERARVKEAGITRENVLVLTSGEKTAKVEEINEEKITNALIKLSRDKKQQVCYITGHGERPLTGGAADSYDVVQRGLIDQAMDIKEVNLPQELKIGENCDVILIVGATRAFFDPEIKALNEYLDAGGRMLLALDLSLRGPDSSPELVPLIENWGVTTKKMMILDPYSRLLGVDASVPVIAQFNEAQNITRDFTKDARINCFFPFARPLMAKGGIEGVTVEWLAKSTPNSWAESDLVSLAKGAKMDDDKDQRGPIDVAFAINGKKKGSQAARNTRIVVFGSALLASNNFSRYGNNLDLFLNSIAWLAEDESMISIRSKEDEAGRIELTQQAGDLIRTLVLWIVPSIVIVFGVVVWVRRRKL